MYWVFNGQQSTIFTTQDTFGCRRCFPEIRKGGPPWLPMFIKPDGAQGYYLRKLCRPWWEAVPVQEAKRILGEQG